MLTKPIHTGTVCGKPLRFFKTPNNDGKPDMQWFAVEDLQICLGMPGQLRKFMRRKMQQMWGAELKTISTPDGVVTIAPHFMVQGMIDAMRDSGIVPETTYNEYAMAGTDAMRILTEHLSFPDDLLPWMVAALKRHDGASDEQR
jgi:hypothetical protein